MKNFSLVEFLSEHFHFFQNHPLEHTFDLDELLASSNVDSSHEKKRKSSFTLNEDSQDNKKKHIEVAKKKVSSDKTLKSEQNRHFISFKSVKELKALVRNLHFILLLTCLICILKTLMFIRILSSIFSDKHFFSILYAFRILRLF